MSGSKFLVSLTILVGLATSVWAQSLRETLEDREVGARWKYNDWESARAAAVQSQKPILALFR